MSDDKPLSDPTNQLACVFTEPHSAESARRALVEYGIASDDIRVFKGKADAHDVDTSEKWFADTTIDIKRYEVELRDGNTVVLIPVKSRESLDELRQILADNNGRTITYFGTWVTEVTE
jgi:hypothetical protein